MVTIRFRRLVLIAYLLFLVPIAVFLFGWVRWYYAIISTVLLAGGLVWIYRSDYLGDKGVLVAKTKHLVLIAVAFGFFTLMSGTCGIGVMMPDAPWRTAIMRDLVCYSWPVVYDQTGFALAYYVGIWMVPALIGKLLGWGGACVTLWLEETAVLYVSFLLIAHLIGAEKTSTLWLIAVFIMGFSGLNIAGACFFQMVGRYPYQVGMHLNEAYCDYFLVNGQPTNFYYRSNIDCLNETYNQILLWIAVPLMLQNRKMHSYIYLGVLLVIFSPWALLGIIPFMLVLGVVELRAFATEHGWRKAMGFLAREVFSPANIVGLVVGLSVFATLLAAGLSTTAVGGGVSTASSSGGFGVIDFSKISYLNWIVYVIFCMLEFGFYMLVMRKKYARDPVFIATLVWLMIDPLLWVGNQGGRDFCMDASLPGLYVLMIYMIRFMKEDVLGKPLSGRNLFFVLLLMIALMTPIMGLCDQAAVMYRSQSLYVEMYPDGDTVTTLNGMDIGSCANFVCAEPDSSFFFTHLAR